MRYSPWWLWVLAKTDQHGLSRYRGGPLWNSLLAHALDTAAVCGELFDQYLSTPTRDRLAEAYGGGDKDAARAVLMLLTALHDLGKAVAGWQRVFLNVSAADPVLQQAGKEWAQHPRQAGLLTGDGWGTARGAPHQHVTARYLPALLGCPCCTPKGERGERHEGLHRAAALLGGHHGHIPSASDIRSADVALSSTWAAIHRELLGQLANYLHIDVADLPHLIDPQRPIALVHLAGLTTLCDWVASDESRFPYREGETPTHWWARSRADAANAVRDLNLRRWLPTNAAWAKLLPDTPTPNALQQAVIDTAPTDGPFLAILEFATGSGKTEAALWLAQHLALHHGYHGFYLAQATRLATEQLSARCARFLTHSIGSETEANLAIVHGGATASAAAEELRQNKGLAQLAETINLTDTAEICSSRAVLDEWFLQQGRGLLSPFGIGTVDQIVLAAQKSRHWFLRLFGLAQKSVIIDEAHAYQMYQQRLLGTAITWLAEAGASVIILSATLPITIRRDLTEAWNTGHRITTPPDTTTAPITFVDAHGHAHHARPARTAPALLTNLHLQKDEGPDALAAHLLTHCADSGITGVIRNRIDHTTDLHKRVLRAAEKHGWDAEKEIVLLHSLFLERDRARIQARLLRQLGPHPTEELRSKQPNPHRPHRLLVLGTQVLEQSLDIDFDLLYADLAPIDLNIQRRGRLWRHLLNRLHLPTDAVPLMHLLWRADSAGLPHVLHADGRPTGVYDPYVQAATWHALNRRTLPGKPLRLTTADSLKGIDGVGTADLIHEIYGALPRTGPEPIHALLARTYGTWQEALAEQARQAADRAVEPYPFGEACGIEDLASGPNHGDPDDPDHPPHLSARSRLGEPTIRAVGLYQDAHGNRSWDPAGCLPADLTRYHPYKQPEQRRAQQREIMLNSIPLPARWFTGRKALPRHHTWAIGTPGVLKRHPVLLLRPDGSCVTPGIEQLTYSPHTGLSRR